MIPKNLAPVQGEELDKKLWESYLLGFGNSLSWSFGTENIITFDYDGNIQHSYKILPESEDFDIESENFKKLISMGVEEEAIINGFIVSKDKTPYLTTVIPAFDEDEEISNILIFITSFDVPLKVFSESTNNSATLYFLNKVVSAIGLEKKIDPATVHKRYVILDLIENYNNDLVLIADVDISRTIARFNSFKLELLIEFVIGLFLFLILVSVFLKKTLNPLSRIADTALKIASGKIDQRAEARGSSEIKSVALAINNMIEKIMERNKHVLDIYKNIKYGIFTVDEVGTIGSEYSTALEQLIETNDISERSIIDLLFKNSGLVDSFSEDELNQISQGLMSMVGESSLVFDLNSHLFPTEIRVKFSNDRVKVFELNWQPILESDDSEITEKIMVILRDVTEIKHLEAQSESQQQQLQMIGSILAVPQKTFESFLQSSKTMTSRSITALNDLKNGKDNDILEGLFRDMHTIKGNSRTLGFTNLAQKAHQIEDIYSDLISEQNDTGDLVSSAADEVRFLEEFLLEYENLYFEKLQGTNLGQDADVKIFEDLVSIIKENSLEKTENPGVKKLIEAVYSHHSRDLTVILEEIWKNIEAVCEELKKPVPKLSISGESIFFSHDSLDILVGVISHCVTNSLDQGIEKPGERKEVGKDEKGSINIEVHHDRESHLITIKIADDGKGLNLKSLKEKALSTGVISDGADDSEVANAIFSSGMSTKQNVTSISGRGVGMNAVKSYLHDVKGEVHIEFTGKVNSNGFRPFQIVLSIPEDLAA